MALSFVRCELQPPSELQLAGSVGTNRVISAVRPRTVKIRWGENEIKIDFLKEMRSKRGSHVPRLVTEELLETN